MTNIGLTSVTFRNKSIAEVVKAVVKVGLNCIEWGGDVHIAPGDMVAAKEAKEMCDFYGITCLSYGSYYKIGEINFDKFQKIIETTIAIGAKIIRVWLGDKSSSEYTKIEELRMFDELLILCNMADKYGIVVASEFHKNTYNDTAESCRNVFNNIKAPNYKTYWQPVRNSKVDLEYLNKIKNYVVTAHIFNWSKSGKRYPLSFSRAKWMTYLQNMSEDVNLIMEFVRNDSEICFLKDAVTLKNIVKGISK